VGNFHELGEYWPPEESIVYPLEVGYLKVQILDMKVLLNPKGHRKNDLADGSRCYARDYSVERNPTGTQC
jgi:hypothetical protein